jgi:hypothetical protein
MGLLTKGQIRVQTDCPVWANFWFHGGLASSSKKSPNANKKAEPCKGILLVSGVSPFSPFGFAYLLGDYLVWPG